MKKVFLLALGFLNASAGMAAQSATMPVSPATQAVSPIAAQATTPTLSPEELQRLLAEARPMEGSCPVSLSARQTGIAWNREVGDRNSAGGGKEVGQSVDLKVAPRDAHRGVVAARVTVHGYANKKRLVQTVATVEHGTPAGGDTARTIEVSFASHIDSEARVELALPGFSAVTSVELKAITYDDGSTWEHAAGNACRAQVDPLMLVGGR